MMKQNENETNFSVPLEIIKASEIEPREVKWLWYPYIPFGKVTLLQGDPGDGKSKLMLSIAALLSKGEPLPFTETEENEPSYQELVGKNGILIDDTAGMLKSWEDYSVALGDVVTIVSASGKKIELSVVGTIDMSDTDYNGTYFFVPENVLSEIYLFGKV